MKKYSLYIITTLLVIIIAALILWLPKKETVDIGEQKQWIEKYLKKADQKQETTASNAEVLDDFKCPEDYESQEDYARDLVMYAKKYQNEHPNINDDEFLKERYNQLVEHNCQKTLENIYSQEPENQPYPIKELAIKENPSFNEVIASGCCVGTENLENCNPYVGKKVQWKAMVSNYAHTSGIRFIVIDNDHPIESYKNHGLFYGTFLASADDPRITEEGVEKWNNEWQMSWVKYIMDTYGNIQDKDRKDDTIFLVSTDIGNVDCYYEGGYIETDIEKIEMIKN